LYFFYFVFSEYFPKGVCGETCQRFCNISSQCDANPCWFGATCVDVANLAYICICPPNYTGKDCRTLVSCQSNSCHNDGTCIQTGIFEERIFVNVYFF